MNKRFFLSAVLSVFIIQVSLAQVNAPSPYPDRIILNLTENPSVSMAVTWRTDTSVAEGFCELQPSIPGPVKSEDSEVFKAKTTTMKYEHEGDPVIESNHHSYIFTGLTPGRKYVYRVGTENYMSEWFEFQTPLQADDKIKFLYFGDPQADLKSQWSRVIRSAYAHVPESGFMVYCGDLINVAGRDIEWDEWFYAGSYIYGMVPQTMTPGNHDYRGLELDPHWNVQFTLPENGPSELRGTCFYTDYKNLRLITIDTAADSELRIKEGTKLEAQKKWLESVLKSNTKQWVIVVTHLPFYSPKESRDNQYLRDAFQPVMEKYNVDMVLSGHDHSYARGRASDNPQSKNKILYAVSMSGPKLYEAANKPWLEHSGEFMELYQIISIEGKTLKYQSYTTNGVLFDQFTLKKNSKGKNKFKEQKPN